MRRKKSIRRVVIIVAALIVAVPVCGCSIVFWTRPDIRAALSPRIGWSSLTRSDLGYSLQYPPSWTPHEYSLHKLPSGLEYLLVLTNTSEEASYHDTALDEHAKVIVSRWPRAAVEGGLQEIADQTTTLYMPAEISQKVTTLDGFPALRVSITDYDRNAVAEYLWIDHGDYVYEVVGYVHPFPHDVTVRYYRIQVRKIINSVHFAEAQ